MNKFTFVVPRIISIYYRLKFVIVLQFTIGYMRN